MVPVTRSCQSPTWIWLVNYLNLHVHLHWWCRRRGSIQAERHDHVEQACSWDVEDGAAIQRLLTMKWSMCYHAHTSTAAFHCLFVVATGACLISDSRSDNHIDNRPYQISDTTTAPPCVDNSQQSRCSVFLCAAFRHSSTALPAPVATHAVCTVMQQHGTCFVL